jgi:hypothetical protein
VDVRLEHRRPHRRPQGPDHALFPYYTDDRIHDSQDQTGGKTILLVARAGRTSLWEPFSQRYEGLYRITRSLSKSVYGNKSSSRRSTTTSRCPSPAPG